MNSPDTSVAIVGGGLVGSLLAIMLARHGCAVQIYERNAEFSSAGSSRGRSINLALAARGIAALRHADIFAEVERLLIPMKGRMLHEKHCEQRLLLYGQRPDEQIYSVSRAALNLLLYEIASQRYSVEYSFQHECVAIDAESGSGIIESPQGQTTLDAGLLIAADGSGSAVRNSLHEQGVLHAEEARLDHGYKEFTIPADAHGNFALDANALHIWPRSEFMLIALPNLDRSFTVTLFLPHHGDPSFACIDVTTIRAFFAIQFPDALALIADIESLHPTGNLSTVSCSGWTFMDRVLLIGDAAHALVPFHGQGMNAGFEDCVELDRLLAKHGDEWAKILPEFESNRKANAQAIAEMALENYQVMRESVRSNAFELRNEVAFELEKRFPKRFIPRYSMVMFHPEISYAEAQRLGVLQAEILKRLTKGKQSLDSVDFELAAHLIDAYG